MERPSLLVLVRHAESLRNRVKKHNTYFPDEESRMFVKGIADHKIPLTECGIEQSIKTGVCLKERFGAFNYVFHSGYLRTVQTMEGILKAYSIEERANMKVRMSHLIRERNPGFTYDMTGE